MRHTCNVKRIYLSILGMLCIAPLFYGQQNQLIWHSASQNSSESMPCGGGDIGLNVWVEEGDVLFYVSRSGTFDENNTLLKQGRFRMRLSPNPFIGTENFRQELKLTEGFVELAAGIANIQIWVDVFHPVIHMEVKANIPVQTELFYENWRYQDRLITKSEGQQCSYKWAPPAGTATKADAIFALSAHESMVEGADGLLFYHRNAAYTVFDYAVTQQGLGHVKEQLMNPLKHLTFGGCLLGEHLAFAGIEEGIYAGTAYRAWKYRTAQAGRKQHFSIVLHTAQTETVAAWQQALRRAAKRIAPQGRISPSVVKQDRQATKQWWKEFWERSFIVAGGMGEAGAKAQEISRNYTLFRYMLGCNAYGHVPTKFNGGLFTFDPCYVDEKQAFTPDYRRWGGGTMTAQNQRLVYWPMLKSGDTDMMRAQFDFYNNMLQNAELRSRVYWQHGGACFAEQIENYGLPNPAEYGFKRPEWFDKGVEYNAWLEYEWDTVLEFCQMILETKNYAGADISPYLPLIESVLTFFDEHYRMRASRRGRKELDGNGHLVLYPGSACETYKMTNNASSTIAGLRTVLATYGKRDAMLQSIPPIPLHYIVPKETPDAHKPLVPKIAIAPAKSWERINNTETPQLYPVFPWRIYGVGKKGLEIARNTYWHDADALRFRSHIGWKQDNIWAACLGLTEEARRLSIAKLSDGPYRFPAFWGPGYDWSPDHNWGGSGMIGLQEMLLQTDGSRILLFPAWPGEWDVHFKLHAPENTTVEAQMKDGKITLLKVLPESRAKDIQIMIEDDSNIEN